VSVSGGLSLICALAFLWACVELVIIARSAIRENRLRRDAQRWRRTWGRR